MPLKRNVILLAYYIKLLCKTLSNRPDLDIIFCKGSKIKKDHFTMVQLHYNSLLHFNAIITANFVNHIVSVLSILIVCTVCHYMYWEGTSLEVKCHVRCWSYTCCGLTSHSCGRVKFTDTHWLVSPRLYGVSSWYAYAFNHHSFLSMLQVTCSLQHVPCRSYAGSKSFMQPTRIS